MYKYCFRNKNTSHSNPPGRATSLQVTRDSAKSLTCDTLRHKRRSSGRLVLEVGCHLARLLVIARQPVHAGLDQDQPELGVVVLPVPLQMLAHGHGLLDQAVEVLRKLRIHTCVIPFASTLRSATKLQRTARAARG